MNNKLILHFDGRNTLFVSDFNSLLTTEEALNTYFSGLVWGTVDNDQWKICHQEISTNCPDNSLISFYKFMETQMVKTPDDRPKLRKKLGKFTQENGTQFEELYLKHLEKLVWNYEDNPTLTVKGNTGTLYHYILPTFFHTINFLYRENRDFAIIIRTFGLDIPPILNAIKTFINGDHPMFPNKLNINLCDYQNQLLMNVEEKEYNYHFKTRDEIKMTSNEIDIIKHWNSINGIAAVKDDFVYWSNNNYHYRASKPLWVNSKFDKTEKTCHHIFFDDCIRPRDSGSIVHLRYLNTDHEDFSKSNSILNQSLILDQNETEKYVNINLVQSDLLECINDYNYFIEKIKLCEQNFASMNF